MPPLQPPQIKTDVALPSRQGTLAAAPDVLVVGGGPAGMGAALGAAAAGAHVLLVERYGFLGGNATAALVMPLMSFHTQRGKSSAARNLMPPDHGTGDPVVGGAVRRFLERLVAAGGAIAPSEETGYVVPFDPESFKMVALAMLDEAGVEYLFHSFAASVLGNGYIHGVVFETKSGPVVVSPKVVIDCTGDGDVAAQAGCPFELGRDDDLLVQPMTLMFRMAGFEQQAFDAYSAAHPDQWRGVHGLWDLVSKATASGELDLPREDVLFFGTPHAHEVSVNTTRITQVLGIDVWDLTYAEWQGRRQMRQAVAFLRKYVPGFEQAYLVQSGVNVGVRETRRILGQYQLTSEDVLTARKFDDVIARSTYPIDIHNPSGKGTILQRVPEGDAYDIPLRCLVPLDSSNLLVAGRCISGTHEAHSSYRVMPVAMATGQAAGVCAAIAAKLALPPRDVPARAVQAELLRQGANLDAREAKAGR